MFKEIQKLFPLKRAETYIWWQRGRMPSILGEAATTPLPTKTDSWFSRSFRSWRSSFATRHDKTHSALQPARSFLLIFLSLFRFIFIFDDDCLVYKSRSGPFWSSEVHCRPWHRKRLHSRFTCALRTPLFSVSLRDAIFREGKLCKDWLSVSVVLD